MVFRKQHVLRIERPTKAFLEKKNYVNKLKIRALRLSSFCKNEKIEETIGIGRRRGQGEYMCTLVFFAEEALLGGSLE